MRIYTKSLALMIGGLFLEGCIVVAHPRPAYVYEGPPAPPPEVVGVAPAPDMVWVGGVYIHEGDHWRWHRGYWRHR